MTAIVKTNTVLNKVNIADVDDTHIFISRKALARQIWIDWKNKEEILWTEYDIGESDMRQKTAKIVTPQYIDLTTGQYCVLITAPDHEDFGGIFLSDEFEYDEEKGLYTYQCQDHSRAYQGKHDTIIKNTKLHRLLQNLITRGGYPVTGKVKSSVKKKWKKVLSGLRPAYQYDQSLYGSTFRFNPMTNPVTAIIRNQSWIETIRNLVYGTGAYIDVYFDKYGILHIEPYHKDDFYNTGLYLTTPEIASAKFKFDTTNILTGVIVQNTDNTKIGNWYGSSSLFNLDLSVFFGKLNGMISNPNQSTTNKTSGKSNKTNANKKSNTAAKTSNPYGTKKKNVYLNIDSIDGHSSDMKKMNDMKKLLKKQGWNVTVTGVGSEAHWKQRGNVKNGIWFCLYGGACAGTLKEHCTSSWFLNPLKKNKSRVVVGFFPPTGSILKGGKYYKHLPPAHDWQGNKAYANIDYPAKFLSKHGIPFMYAKNAKEMVSKFLAGGDNYSTEGSNYKNYDSWKKHDVKWI